MLLPCGRCTGCRVSKARDWALRCTLELSRHDEACFVTLTYDDDHVPPTLRKAHLSGWLKRVRARLRARRVRFFACGEYGEQTHRPHYHALLFGVRDSPSLQASWPFGFIRVDPCTPASVAYVAGYVSKKFGPQYDAEERIDYATGEVYRWQPPFILMSRGGRAGVGIGGHAREHYRSWRDHAVYHGKPVPVPRYLHESWKLQATPDELERFAAEQEANRRELTKYSLRAAEAIAEARLGLKSSSRRKL